MNMSSHIRECSLLHSRICTLSPHGIIAPVKPKSVIRTSICINQLIYIAFSSVLPFFSPSCFPFGLAIARYAFDKTVAIRTKRRAKRIGNLMTDSG